MKMSSLLAHRRTLQNQARLANMAFAYARLGDFAERISRTKLSGSVHLIQLRSGDETEETSMLGLQVNQSVIEEHFTETDLRDLADAVSYATSQAAVDVVFELTELDTLFRAPLGKVLRESGIRLDEEPHPADRGQTTGD